MARKPSRMTLINLLLAGAMSLAGAGTALANEERVAVLENRVAELESLVQQLLLNHAPPMSDDAAFEDRIKGVVEASVASALDEHHQAVGEEHHETVLAPEQQREEQQRRHSYQFGGYVKNDIIYSDYGDGSVESGSAGRDFYIPTSIPAGIGGESYLDVHARESRINFRSDHHLENNARMGTFVEVDFLLSGQGNERVSNSYSPRLRHAFVTYDKWLFGQTWTTFFNVTALPENLDFIGPSESTIFGRQGMVRYTHGPWQFALENPETTITPYGGGSTIVADDNHVPDAVLRYNHAGNDSMFTIAAILRQLACDDDITGVDDTTTGFGISVSGKIDIGSDDFRWMASAGAGMGRYIGLNTANGAVLDEHGKLEAIESSGLFGSYRHFWNQRWRSNLTLGYLAVDNDVALSGNEVTKNASSLHLNLIYSPQPRLDFGVEFLYADRELEDGSDGDMTRLQFSAKYAY